MHKTIEPAILYFGTPVVLISTVNEDGSINLAPSSSIFWLSWSCMIGLDATSKTVENLKRTGECVLNLASDEQVEAVNNIAKTTGSKKLPLHKKVWGYQHEKNKFERAGMTEQPSVDVKPSRAKECPVQLEAKLCSIRSFGKDSDKMPGPCVTIELDVLKVHAHESILVDKEKDYVDPDKWHPLIMSFRKFYSTRKYIHHSTLSEGGENQYATWKRKGLVRKLTEWLLARSTSKFKHVSDE